MFKRGKEGARTSVTLGVASVANDVIMRIAGFVAAGTGRRYGDWRQVRVASAVGTSRTGRATL